MEQDETNDRRTKMGMLGKIATTIIGTRIAAETGKAGLVGAAAGMIATRIITRSPMGALAVGGAYVAHKLLQKKREIDRKGPHQAAVDDGLADGGPAKTNGAAPLRKKRGPYRKRQSAATVDATEVAATPRPATP
jgi:uncharacterized membrane protein YeaQ/YmgE (transglycosylase-associated protein family)